MKKITLLLFAFLSITIASHAAVTFPVDYTTFFAASAINSGGTTLETGNASAVGTWTVGTAGSATNPSVATNNLSYSTYVDNNSGKKILLPSLASGTPRTSFFYLTSSASDLTTNTYYLGFLINTSVTPSSGVIFLNFGDGNPGTQRGRMLIKQNTGNTGYLIQASVDGTPTATTNTISYNSTHFIVLKYQITTASATVGAASMTLFVDPTIGGTEPASTFTISDTGISSLTCIKSLMVQQQIGLATEIAGLRMSTSWADVCKAAAAPKLSTPIASAASPITSTGFTANWSSVSNAQSYSLSVSQNGTPISGSPFTGLSGTNYSVTGLSSFLTYTYTVTAVGDGTNYNNSDPSSIISVTTTDPNAVSSINPVFGDGSWTSLTSSFGTASINGYDFVQANITSANYYGSKGEKHTTYIALDKLANGGKITMPTVNSVSQIEIHAATGTAERTFSLKEFNTTTSAWDLVGTYTYNTASKNTGLDSVYIISISRSVPSKFRIENAGAGSMYVMQVITRTAATSLLTTPIISNVTNIIGGGFTANWNTVTNATAYRILVIGNGPSGITSKIRYAYTVSGQSTNTYNVTGTDSISSARVRVSAIGDDITYSDSYLSLGTSTFSVLKSQVITFAALAAKNYGDASSTLSATGGSSGNPVVFTSSDPNVATCTGTNGTTLTIVAPGSCTIYANQIAGGLYAAAVQVSRTLLVNQGTPVITVTGSNSFTYNGSAQGPNTATTGGSTGSVSFSYAGINGTNYAASSTAPTNAGYYTVTAIVDADVNYISASSAATPFTIYSSGTVSGANTKISDLILSASSDITVAANASLNIDKNTALNSITVSPTAKLSVNNGKTLNGLLTLQSSADGTATLVDSCSSPTISATVEQYLTAGRNWYLSSPVSAADYSVLNKGNYVVEWNEASKAWDNVTSGNLLAGKGYVQIAGPDQGTTGVVNFSGTTNSGNVSVLLTRTESGSSRGFNLVGNPYPSFLDWKKIAAANTDLLPTTWLRTKSASAYVFATVNVAAFLNDNSNPPVITSNSANTSVTSYIPPMQAHWVRLNASIPTSNYNLNNSMRDHADNSGNTFKAPAQKSSVQTLLRLEVSNGTYSDEAVIYFNPNATNVYDVYDSPKMTNASVFIPEIYTVASGEQLVINCLNSVEYDTEIPLGFTTGQTNNFSIKASQISNFAPGTQIVLKDYQDINNPVSTVLDDASSYSFSSDPTTNNLNRFTVIFHAPTLTTGTHATDNVDAWISTNANGQIIINGNPDRNTSIAVYNSTGQVLFSEKLRSTNLVFRNKFNPGVYMLTICEAGKYITKKLVIN